MKRLAVSVLALVCLGTVGARAQQISPRDVWPQATSAVDNGDLDAATRNANQLIDVGTRLAGLYDGRHDLLDGGVQDLVVAVELAYDVALAHVMLVEAEVDPLVAAVAAVVAVANLTVAVLNLLPGLPLDGGRVLKAAVWSATGDETRATRIAARAGRALAGTLLFVAVIASASGDAASAIWSGALGLTILRNI